MSTTEIELALWQFINGKGGVGKTLSATFFAEWLNYSGIVFRLLDCDDNSSLSKRLPEAQRHTVKSSSDIESLVGRIVECPVTLADCPSNITAEVDSLFLNTDFGPALESIHGQLVIILPIVTNDPDCLDEVRRIVKAIKTTAKYLIIRNERNGTHFSAFDASPTAMYLQEKGAKNMILPRLDDHLTHYCNVDRLTVAQFLGQFYSLKESNPMAAFPRAFPAQRAAILLRNVFSQLNDLAPFLLPPALAANIQPISVQAVKAFACRSWATKQTQLANAKLLESKENKQL